MFTRILLLLSLVTLMGCQTEGMNTSLSGGTGTGYGLGVMENSGRLSH